MSTEIAKLELIASLFVEEVKSTKAYIASLESKNDTLAMKEDIARLEKELKDKALEIKRQNRTIRELNQKLAELNESSPLGQSDPSQDKVEPGQTQMDKVEPAEPSQAMSDMDNNPPF